MHPEHRILVPMDFRSPSLRACDRALELADELRASLTLLHVVETPGYHLMPTAMDQFRAAAEEAMARHAERLRAFRPTFETRIVEGEPWEAIVEAIDALEPSLVVIGTHGRRGLARLALGSVAGNIVRRSPVPVLTVPAHAFESRQAAGRRLASALATHELSASPAVVAVGRGALPVADEVATALGGTLDFWGTAPIVVDGRTVGIIGEDELAYYEVDGRPLTGREAAEVTAIAQVRDEVTALRGSRTVGSVVDQLVVLVSDGLTTATGITSAVRALAPLGASGFLLAAPIATRRALSEVHQLVDEVVSLEMALLADVGETAYYHGKPPSYRESRALLDVLRGTASAPALHARRAS